MNFSSLVRQNQKKLAIRTSIRVPDTPSDRSVGFSRLLSSTPDSRLLSNAKPISNYETNNSQSDADSDGTFSSIMQDFEQGQILEQIGSYISIAHAYMHRRDKEGAVYTWKKVLKKINKPGNERAIIGATKILAELYFEFKDTANALEQYKALKSHISILMNTQQGIKNDREKEQTNKKMLREKMFAYKQMGICYQSLKQYSKALICYKLMLKLAWENDHKEMELLSYDRMGMWHYYLGDMDRAAYYHDRMQRGKYESTQSDIRKISNASLKKSHMLKRGNKGLNPIATHSNLHSHNPSINKLPIMTATASAGQLKQRPIIKPLDLENIHDISDTSIHNLPSPHGGAQTSEALYVLANCPFEANKDDRMLEKKRSMPSLKSKTLRPINPFTGSRSIKSGSQTARNSGYKGGIRPFILINHISPNRNINNFHHLDPINTRKMHEKMTAFAKDLKKE